MLFNIAGGQNDSLMEWYLCKDFFDKNRLHKIVMFISEYANQSGRLDIII